MVAEACFLLLSVHCSIAMKNVAASLASAGLIRLAEMSDSPLLFTTDHDFRIYRRHGRQMIPLVSP
jgi:hypothetical protein